MGVFFALEWSKFDFNIAQQSGHDLTKHVTCSYQAARLPCGWRGISKHALHLCFCEFFAYGADAFTLNPSTVLNWIFFVVSRMFMVIYIWNDQDPHIFDMDNHRWLKHKNHDAVCLEILPLQVINAVSMSLWLMKYLNWFWLSWVVSQSINWKIQKHILRMWLFAYLKVERPKWKAFPTNGPPFLQLPKTRPIPICPPPILNGYGKSTICGSFSSEKHGKSPALTLPLKVEVLSVGLGSLGRSPRNQPARCLAGDPSCGASQVGHTWQ